MQILKYNPFNFNTISLKKNIPPVQLTPEAKTVAEENKSAGWFLGVRTDKDWNKYHDKVNKIVSWAASKAGTTDKNKVLDVLEDNLKNTPELSDKRVTDYYIASELDSPKKENNDSDTTFDFKAKTKVNDMRMPTKDEMVTRPDYTAVAKAVGVLNSSGWSAEYDNVFLITEWAKEQSKLTDPQEIVSWLRKKIKSLSGFETKPLDDLANQIKALDSDK